MAEKKQESLASRNIVEVCGKLKENKLSIDKDKINGSVIVQYGAKADQQVEVSVYIGSKKKDGEPNQKYTKMKDIVEGLVSMANATEESPASLVRIYGNKSFTPTIKLEEYVPEGKNEIVEILKVEMGFGNFYVGDIATEDFKGAFEMVTYLSKNPTMEMKNDEETGRLLVEGLYVTHKGEVKPVSFVVEEEDLVEGISECEKGQTLEIWGDIKIAKIKESKIKNSGLGGKAKTDEKTTTTRELVITGGNIIDEDDKEAISSSFVKTAVGIRNEFLEGLKSPAPKQPKGKGSIGGKSKASSIDDDDIPF